MLHVKTEQRLNSCHVAVILHNNYLKLINIILYFQIGFFVHLTCDKEFFFLFSLMESVKLI